MATATAGAIRARSTDLLREFGSPRSVFIAALLVRLLAVAVMDATYRRFIFADDGLLYVRIADNLLQGNGYGFGPGDPALRLPPLFTFLIVGLRLLQVDIVPAVGVVNAILGAATCVGVYWIARRTFANPRVAPVAGLILAFYPFHIFNTAYVLKETLGVGSLVLAVGLWMEALARGSARWAAAAGFATAVAVAARYYPTVGLPAALLIGLGFERLRRRFDWWPIALGLLAGLMLALAPWVARNWIATGQLMVSPFGLGYYLYSSNGPGLVPETDGYYEAQGLQNAGIPRNPGQEGPDEGGYFLATVQAITADPGRVGVLIAAKVVNMWRPVWAGSSWSTTLVLGGSYVGLLVLTLVGAWRRGPGRFRATMVATIVLYVVAHLVFWGMVRERIYIEPFLVPFAAAGALVVLAAWLSKPSPAAADAQPMLVSAPASRRNTRGRAS